jgi:hydroxyacylglutathione hydrolase
MAPPIADLIDAELAAGTLVIRKGNLERVEATQGGAKITFRRPSGITSLATTRVINCTGPNMNYRSVNSPLLNSLFSRGLASPGPLGGGFNCTRSGALIGAGAAVSSVLFTLGPSRLGTLIEAIAIPEICQQAFELATLLADRTEFTERFAWERERYRPLEHGAVPNPAAEAV